MKITFHATQTLAYYLHDIMTRLGSASGIHLCGSMFVGEHQRWFIPSISTELKKLFNDEAYTMPPFFLLPGKNIVAAATINLLEHECE